MLIISYKNVRDIKRYTNIPHSTWHILVYIDLMYVDNFVSYCSLDNLSITSSYFLDLTPTECVAWNT